MTTRRAPRTPVEAWRAHSRLRWFRRFGSPIGRGAWRSSSCRCAQCSRILLYIVRDRDRNERPVRAGGGTLPPAQGEAAAVWRLSRVGIHALRAAASGRRLGPARNCPRLGRSARGRARELRRLLRARALRPATRAARATLTRLTDPNLPRGAPLARRRAARDPLRRRRLGTRHHPLACLHPLRPPRPRARRGGARLRRRISKLHRRLLGVARALSGAFDFFLFDYSPE